jgi:1-aminocyclopropane-1-carboxylate deaminase/D-cysteine desulfhydrase-like pyridoxal-dependent ACC family enzyme
MPSGPITLRRLRLAQLPTPLEPAPGLGAAIGCPGLWLKREDLSGLGLGGNKPRQLEVLLAEAEAAGADTIITTAGAQSNFCRATAAACAELGWRCVLLLRGDGTAEPTGNLLLGRLFGAEIHWIDTTDPYADAVQERLDALETAVLERGGKPWQIRLPGKTGALAAAAAISLADELAAAWSEPPDIVCVAAGSGLTVAGLLAGFAKAGIPSTVLAVSVQQPSSFIRPLILKRAQEAAELMQLDAVIDAGRLVVDDDVIAPGYGLSSPASLAALSLAGRAGGLVLDPAYTAKALAALIARLGDGRITAEARVIFVHTGSAPGFFAQTAAIGRYLDPP